MRYEKCEQCGNRVAAIALSSNAFLAVLKLVVGGISGSKACIADSLYSATVFVMALAMILGQKLAKQEENSRFHYGYGKVEAVVAGSIAFLLICGAGVLIWNAVQHLMNAPRYGPPHLSALAMAVTSIVAADTLARYLRCVGTQFKSRSILSTARAHRESFLASFIVLVGVIGSELGFGVLDPIAALVVVALIMKSCVKLVMDAVKVLMDSSINGTYGNKIRSIVEDVEGVRQISVLRTRQIGHKIWLDLDIGVDPKKSIREANLIAQRVRSILLKQIGDLERVMVNCSPMEEDRC